MTIIVQSIDVSFGCVKLVGPFIHRFIHLPRFFSIPFNADALAIAANDSLRSGRQIARSACTHQNGS
jgi:hypothetical protein